MPDNLKCKNCKPPERHAGCHATCSYYQEWNETHLEEKKKEHNTRWLNSLSKK